MFMIIAYFVLLCYGVYSHKCENITISICQDVGYNLTMMPNFQGHSDQSTAERELQEYLQLIDSNCSRHLRLFLCSVFVPLCTPHLPGALPPCRALCESVYEECQATVDTLNSPWPNCSHFPRPEETALCLPAPREDQPSTAEPRPLGPGPPTQSESFPLGPGPPTQCPPNFARARLYGRSGITCSPRCGFDAYYRADDKRFAENWTTGWAWLCFLSSLFTLLTFIVERARFQYPERPVVFLALCYNLLALAYIARGALGHAAFSCVSSSDILGIPYVAVDGLESGGCTLTFLVTYYFQVASGAWWVVLAGAWFLSAAKKWSCEALHAVSPYFHLAAWGAPAVLGITALALHGVSGDELTGMCQISDAAVIPFLVAPHTIMLMAGTILGSLGGAALLKVRRAVRAAGRSTAKMERLMTRLGVFAALYILPAVGTLACLLHEAWHRPRWRSLALLAALDCGSEPGCEPGPSYRAAGVEVVLLRIFLSLVVGVTSGIWVWSGKTCRAWSNKLFGAPKKPRLPLAQSSSPNMNVSHV